MTAKSTTKKSTRFSEDERAAMKERARELKAAASGKDGETEVLAKIAAMKGTDRSLAKQIHALVKANAPELSPKTWYGMPAYANKDGKVVCYFQNAQKFKTRYATFGFSDQANLDDGPVWPVVYAVSELTDKAEAQITALLKKAVS